MLVSQGFCDPDNSVSLGAYEVSHDLAKMPMIRNRKLVLDNDCTLAGILANNVCPKRADGNFFSYFYKLPKAQLVGQQGKVLRKRKPRCEVIVFFWPDIPNV